MNGDILIQFILLAAVIVFFATDRIRPDAVAIASLCGGMLTLISTPPNLAVSGVLERSGQSGFAFFDFLPIGLVILLSAMAWLALVGSRQLKEHAKNEETTSVPTLLDLARKYRQLDVARSYHIEPGSPLAGRTPASLNLREAHGITLVMGPGGYRFSDFFKVGLPLLFLAMIASLLLVPLVFPWH